MGGLERAGKIGNRSGSIVDKILGKSGVSWVLSGEYKTSCYYGGKETMKHGVIL